MDHRGIAYEVRARGYPNKWEWAVYPNSASTRVHWTGEVTGGRQNAIAAAQQFIDSWLEKRPEQRPEQRPR